MAQFPAYRISVTDNLRTGNAVNANRTKSGIPLAGDEGQAVLVLSLGAPIAADDDGICAQQTAAGAGDLTINGALASGGAVTLDVPRCVQVDAAGAATAVVTVYGTDVFVGTTSKLGLPYRPVVGGFIRGILNENTADAGTYVAPSRVTATATTVDVRGTYAPAGTLNGTNVYKVAIAVQNGPNDSDAFGVAQFNG
jgi:hypothetical protein